MRFIFALLLITALPMVAQASTDSQCDAAYSADDYGSASVYCTTGYEEHYTAAQDERGQPHDLDMLLAAESLHEAAYANIKSGLDVEKGRNQWSSSIDMLRTLTQSRYAKIRSDAQWWLNMIAQEDPQPPDYP